MPQQFLKRPDMDPSHGQMNGISVLQVVESEISDTRPFAGRSKAVLHVPDVPPVPIAEYEGVLRGISARVL